MRLESELTFAIIPLCRQEGGLYAANVDIVGYNAVKRARERILVSTYPGSTTYDTSDFAAVLVVFSWSVRKDERDIMKTHKSRIVSFDLKAEGAIQGGRNERIGVIRFKH